MMASTFDKNNPNLSIFTAQKLGRTWLINHSAYTCVLVNYLTTAETYNKGEIGPNFLLDF